MRILLDTTYLLPLIGISVRNLPDNVVLELLSGGYEVYVNDIVFFELSAKASKYIIQGILPPIRVLRGITALIHDTRVRKVYLSDMDMLTTAFKIRSKLEDFIDSIMISTAIHYCNIMLTEDKIILNLAETSWFKELAEQINPKIKILNYITFKNKAMQKPK